MKLTVERHPREIEQLIRNLERAAANDDIPSVTARVKAELETFSREAATALPARYRAPRQDGYARRLLHRDPRGAFTVVVMAWGPDQATQLHDHAGIWCVECVVQGELHVTQYDLLEQRDDLCRFEQRKHIRASVGDAGCLIPPFEYHVIANALPRATSATLHVYGGEMDTCHCYRPLDSGWWQRCSKRLAYDA